MVKAKRARTVETPKQPSFNLRLRAPYFYPDLMDGQDALWKAGWGYLPATLAEVTAILDLLHALGYLWEAAL
ncbi:MAG: hypothetical protein P8Y27_07560 [Chromatiaceae bacterium]